jgi:ferric-dicitrate binding protein FerR (iron transport regulator)
MAPFSKAQRTTYLISRYVDGAIDFAELKELDHWRKSDKKNEALFQATINLDQQAQAIQRMQGYNSKASLEKIKLTIQQNTHQIKIHKLNWKKLMVAAVSLLVVGILFFEYQHLEKNNQVATLKPQQNFVPAGTNKATLTLANGKKINLDDSHNGTIAQQSGTLIQKHNGGLIAYLPVAMQDVSDTITEYNTIETPMGGQYRLQLPDGTKVWLNAASSLKYPSSFKGKQRQVTLTGEGYFEVVHNARHPFIVKTATQTIQDIGTVFNVNAYRDEPNSTTTLVEGAIQLVTGNKKIILKPGQHAINQSNNIKVADADVETATAWKNGQLAFHHSDLQNVLRQISRWYNVEIAYQGKVPAITISGGVSRTADLSAILKMLQLSEVHFSQQGRKLIIKE